MEDRFVGARGAKRGLLIVAVSLLATLALSANALGFGYTIPLSRLSSGTGATLNWKGMVGTPCTVPRMTPQMCLDGQLRGTVFESWSLFKETDSDANYDYYVAQTYVTWKMTGGADFGFGNAPGWIQIWSDKAASGGFFDGNESASVGPIFCADLSIGAQIGFFSISANPRLCNSAWLNMTTLNATNAIWRTDMVHHTPKWDVWYAIKVPAGVKPKFTFVLTFPYFTVHTHTGSQPTYDKLYYSYSIAVTA